MDPCPFVRILIDSLALKLPVSTKPAGSRVYPSATPCFCKLKMKNFPSQTALVPLCSAATGDPSRPEPATSFAGFHLDSAAVHRLSAKPITVKLSVYSGHMGRMCGITGNKLLGRAHVAINLDGAESKPTVFHNGWVKIGYGKEESVARLHLTVRAEPDPRFVFQFGGEPECSPVVFQIQGKIRQPVFSCKFSADRNTGSRSLSSEFSPVKNPGWIRTSNNKEKAGKDRKGWRIMIHDLSGSPVAVASMITPFVPSSPGSDRVSRSNPGVWLILRPHGSSSVSNWKPWGRLVAWRERGCPDGLGFKFELILNSGLPSGVPLAEGTMSVKKGGQFRIDGTGNGSVEGFVMASTVEGEGKFSKPVVQVASRHVTSTGDAALFVALSAAIDLSMDACQLFSRKLRKEFCHDDDEWDCS